MGGMDEKPQGPYTRWTNQGYDGWSWEDHPTLDSAVHAPNYGSTFVITKPVSVIVAEVVPNVTGVELESV